jgi:single-stranded DNA-binding protein
MLNSVVLAGNLGNDPDIHFNSEGEPIASFAEGGGRGSGDVKVTVSGYTAERFVKNPNARLI